MTYVKTDDKSDNRISKDIKKIEKVIAEGFDSFPINRERSNLSKSMNVWHTSEAEESSVKLEIGAKIHPLPTVEKTIKSYIHEYLIDEEVIDILEDYYFSDVNLIVLDITRTFIDKVYAVKTQSIVGDITLKVRHVYDVVQLFKHEEVQKFLEDKEELETIIGYAKEASEFYVTKRDIISDDELYGRYNFTDWRDRLDKQSVRSAYEKLHEELLYTDEKQNFDDALTVFEEIDSILNNLP